MTKPVSKGTKIAASRPVSAFRKPLEADLKALFKALAKGIGHTTVGKWEELGVDATEALSSLGLTTNPEELIFLLIRRSLSRSLFDLVGEAASLTRASDTGTLSVTIEDLDLSDAFGRVSIDKTFLERPGSLPLLAEVSRVLAIWLTRSGLEAAAAEAISRRLPGYFVFALNQEWRANAKTYQPLLAALDTPFSKAGEKEWSWLAYSALLERRTEESVFGEPFSLKQIYIPLNAFYVTKPSRKEALDGLQRTDAANSRIVVSLETELRTWLEGTSLIDAIRVISGGPGSGKSTFARILAARLSAEARHKVLFVPLHLIDPTKNLVEEVGRYLRDEGVLAHNPLDPESAEDDLLVIFDGLDELASQGKAAAETARAFVREVERTAERRNIQKLRFRVLLSGREVVVQENESEFRHPRQVLTLLPYFAQSESSDARYADPEGLLAKDLRQDWWRNYGALTGKGYSGLPAELSRADLTDVTAQPLLSYLVALSYSRGSLDFQHDVNLNSVYADLVAAVHERGYEKQRTYGPIRHMKLDDFCRVLEEIGLAAWHGDGRTTTVAEIDAHCRSSGLGTLLDVFQEGAKVGVSRLLAAFFFRQHGQRQSGDPTFVFTHKSFGEYLTARRVVRCIDRVARERRDRALSPDRGWDERDALKHWAQICGPSPMSPYLFRFILSEIELRDAEVVKEWQAQLVELFGFALHNGLPLEQLALAPFQEALFQSRNAEESLLAALNSCARVTRCVSDIKHPDRTSFGAWLRRIQGQRSGPESVLAAHCLSYLNLRQITLDISDLYHADFSFSDMEDCTAHYACCMLANFSNANMSNSTFAGAMLAGAVFTGARVKGLVVTRALAKDATFDAETVHEVRFIDRSSGDDDSPRRSSSKTPRTRRASTNSERPRAD